MLRKLRLLYYNNKEKIWVAIGIIVFVIVIIQIINYNIKKNREEELNNLGSNNYTNQTYLPSKSFPIMSGSKVSDEELEEDTNLIKEFIDYGNSNNVEGAYNLLSQECKDEMFSDIDRFYNNYFKNIFYEKKSYDLDTWDSTANRVTYRVKYLNDIMSTGKVNEEFIEDYITIITENEEKKLNINEFIDEVEMEKEGNIDGLKASVISKCYYYDYEIFEITFKNETEGQITIDSKDDTESVYIKDTNGVKYSWFGNEIANQDLILEPGGSITLKLKFNKLYNQNRKDKTINFTDVLINNEIETLEIKL